ncbi:collagen-binding protein [Bacteroidia bacterium]|nr:collagen-binding protein [Bacteroidia bacterium]
MAASIELLAQKDSTYVLGGISDENGIFILKNLAPNNYILKITFIGYIPVIRNVTLEEDKPSTNLGRIEMTTNDILLKEAIVEGKKPEIIVKNDTVEYDAGSYKTPENAVVEDLLKKLPGVEVDKDGKITVNGKEVKKFKVDGKDFFSDDPQVTSKNLPADMVDKLQVIDEKSDMARMTGFDDGDEMTIINLTVRPGMKKGTMGNALLGLGSDINIDNDLRYQGSAFLNHMQNETRYTLMLGRNNNNNMGAADLGANRFGGMRMRRGGGGGVATSDMLMMNMNKAFSPTLNLNGDFRFMGNDRFSNSKNESVTNKNGNQRQKDYTSSQNNYVSNNFAVNFTLEWKPDTMNTLTFRPNFGYNNSHSNESGTSDRYNLLNDDNLGNTIFESKSDAYSKGHGYDVNATLDYAHRFGKLGRVFSINMQSGYNANTSAEHSTTIYENPTSLYRNLYQQDENDGHTTNFRTTVSFVEPLWKNTFLQASYRIAYNDSKNINSTFDISGGTTASRVDSLSRSTVRNSITQRIGLSMKFVRPKYNYTIGFNVDPSRSENKTYQPFKWQTLDLPYTEDVRLTNIMGDSLFSNIPQSITNFSPIFNFNYNFGQRSNLRINYEGETNQPSATQLRDYTDMSNPTSWVKGNPHLKPGYANDLRIRFQKYVPETQLMYNAEFNGGFSLNDIAATTIWQGDSIRITTYDNISGNWNANLRGMFNIPLRNKKFTIGNFANLQVVNQNSYISDESDKTSNVKNTMKTYGINDRGSINYRSELFDIGMDLSIGYTHIASSIRQTDNKETLNLGIGANTTWYLPYHITIDTDINYTKRSGSFDNYNIPETMWNASVTKQLFSKSYGVGSLKLQVYDILQNRSSINASTTTNGYRISQVNVIPSYFIGSFIYKFSAFPKSGSATESDVRGEGRWRGGEGQGPGQGPGRGGFGGVRPF